MTAIDALDPAEWGEAYQWVEDYLRAYRITNRMLLNRLTQQIIGAAADRRVAEPEKSPVEVAAEEAWQWIDGWVQELVHPTEDESEGTRFARGRAAIHLAALPENWPACFLDFREPPPELIQNLREVYLQSGPDLAFSNMVPRPIDLGPLSVAADTSWRTFDRVPLLRAGLGWILFGIGLGTIFLTTRF